MLRSAIQLLLPLAVLSATSASAELIGFWKLDDAADPARTVIASVGENGVYENFADVEFQQPPSPGDSAGNSVELTSADADVNLQNRINFGAADDIVGNRTQLSVSIWAMFANNSADHTLLSNDAFGSQASLLFWRDEAGTSGQRDILSLIIGGVRIQSDAGVLPDANVWYHLAFTYDGSAATPEEAFTLYVNGVDVTDTIAIPAEAAIPTAIPERANPLTSGQSAIPFSRALRGFLDEISIFNSALSAEEIASLADGESPSSFGDGPPFRITEYSLDSETDMFSLSWNTEPGQVYTIFYTDILTDLQRLGDIGDDLVDNDANDSDPTEGTYRRIFPNPDPQANRLFFSVFENENP